MSVEKYMSENKPNHKSKLDPFRSQITKLINNGYSTKQILVYLRTYEKVNISLSNLYKFIKTVELDKKPVKKSEQLKKVKEEKEELNISDFEKIQENIKKLKEENPIKEVKYFEPQSS